MPLYEYHCDACETTREKLIKHLEEGANYETIKCECGSDAHRIMSLGTFALKGDWFKTTRKY